MIVEIALAVLNWTIAAVNELLQEARKQRFQADIVEYFEMDNRLINRASKGLAQEFALAASTTHDRQQQRNTPRTVHDMGSNVFHFDFFEIQNEICHSYDAFEKKPKGTIRDTTR